MTLPDHLIERPWPCPHCGYNVVGQLIADIDRCPECGGALPVLGNHSAPIQLIGADTAEPR